MIKTDLSSLSSKRFAFVGFIHPVRSSRVVLNCFLAAAQCWPQNPFFITITTQNLGADQTLLVAVPLDLLHDFMLMLFLFSPSTIYRCAITTLPLEPHSKLGRSTIPKIAKAPSPRLLQCLPLPLSPSSRPSLKLPVLSFILHSTPTTTRPTSTPNPSSPSRSSPNTKIPQYRL